MTAIMDLSFPGQRTITASSCIPHDSVYMPGPRAGKSENGFFVVIPDSKYYKMTPKFVKQKSHRLHSSIKFANPDWSNEIGQVRSWGPICSFTSMITDWIGRDKVLFPKLFENENTKLSNNFWLEVKKKKTSSCRCDSMYVNYNIPYYRLGLSETRANITVKL